MQIDPTFPASGEKPWGDKLNTALDEMVDQGNSADAILETGRLSVDNLATTIAEVATSNALNPESGLNGAIITGAESVIGGDASGLLRVVDARGNTSTPRPEGFTGSVLWKINEGEADPLNYDISLGDMCVKVDTEPAPFTPLQLPGIIAWLDALSLVGTYTQGQELAFWPNLIDGYPDALPIVADVGPTFAEAGINAGPGVLFGGVNGGVKISGLAPYAGPVTIYMVAISSPGTTTGTDFFFDGISSTVAQLQMALGRTNTNLWSVVAGDTFTKTGANNALHLFKVEYGNPTSTLRVGGSSQSGTTNDGPAIIGYTIGSRGDGANALDGVIGMWVVVQGSVSPEYDAKMVAYALEKYGAS